jgi:Protein of unknown function (DUF3175)
MRTDDCSLPLGIFNHDAETIAKSLASTEIFPDGPAAGMRILTFYISHSGKRLSANRLRSLEKARKLLAARVDQMVRAEARRAA